MKYSKGMPRPAQPGELVALDVEVFGQAEPFHIPTGDFACLTVVYENGDRYMIEDTKDLPETFERISQGLWCMHNALYDIAQLRRWATLKPHDLMDIMVFERDMFGGYYDSFSLDALSRRYLNKALEKDIREQFGAKTKMTKKMELYAIRDSDATVKIARCQLQEADKQGSPMRHYWEVDQWAVWAFADMEPAAINVEGWHNLADGFAVKGQEIEEELGFNVYSTDACKKVIYEVTGRRLSSTNAKVVLEPMLEELEGDGYDLIQGILRARSFRKATSTYGHLWPERWADENGWVIPSWRVTGTETGRVACRSPNLMNIPVRTMPEFRRMFISKHDGGRIMVSDVQQQEPRILAHFSQDQRLLEAFKQGLDIHQAVADRCGVERFMGKQINLGLSYGLTPYGLARNAKISKVEAEKILREYFAQYRGVKAYMARERAKGYRQEKVHSALGRPVWLNLYARQWQNNAVNSPIQSSAGDQTKLAIVKIWRETESAGLPFGVCINVHDEIVLDILPGTTQKYRPIVNQAWTDAGKELFPDIPMVVDIKTGDSWGIK